MTIPPKIRPISDLLSFYQEVRSQSWALCRPLQREDFVVQPITDVSPPKWHLGHTTWFFENLVLAKYVDGYTLFDERLNYLFNSYYESLGPRILRSNRGNITRPSLQRVIDYRQVVDEHMEQLLHRYAEKGGLSQELHDLIVIGLHHEQQHQELLLTDIKYILGANPLHPAYVDEPAPLTEKNVGEAGWLSVAEGIYPIGYAGDGFCYDNELGAHQVFLHDFQIQDRLVTNGEYLEFMQAGGYEQFQHWLSEGWEWVKQLDVKAPLYWYRQDGTWYHYTLRGLQLVDPDLPVTHVSYFEADAYAHWRGLRLPTEFEWETACRMYYAGIPDEGNFVEQGHFHPVPRRSEGDYQMLGNVWEWTGSAYLPYPGYPRQEGALGEYNAKFMINQMVLRGGSCATPASHIRPTYRNFFHADKRWQFTGIRLAR